MVRSLLSLYVRVGAGVANLALRVAARSVDLATDAVRMAVPSPGQAVRGESEDVFAEPVEATPGPLRDVDQDRAPPQPPDDTGDKAKTIDDEPELVAEVAAPGAEEGVSAELEVDQPWEGYDDLTADEVIARIGEADAAELAVLELYERAHNDRRTVLTAAERRMRELANAPS